MYPLRLERLGSLVQKEIHRICAVRVGGDDDGLSRRLDTLEHRALGIWLCAVASGDSARIDLEHGRCGKESLKRRISGIAIPSASCIKKILSLVELQ